MALADRRVSWWHLPILLGLSLVFEGLFVRHGLNLLDEGWPLYAAARLRDGGTLYRDVFFVFPPGHLLPAWIGTALDSPGVVGARLVYAAFATAAVASVYLLGRRVMPASFALLAGCLLAIAAPDSHLWHTLFGYRYFAFSGFAVLAFAGRLRSGHLGFMLLAGALVGLGLCFRITPALAATAGIGVGVLASSTEWRSWLRDGVAFGLGVALTAGPVVVWLIASAGADAVWRELLVRPVVMTGLQSVQLPALELPDPWSRATTRSFFVAVQFRLYLALYAIYALLLGAAWLRALIRRRRFEPVLLLAVVIFGGVYFLRTLGRSDSHHLYSALPPVCLLLAHGLSVGFHAATARLGERRLLRQASCLAVCGAAFVGWGYLMTSDLYLDGDRRGAFPVRSMGASVRVPWPPLAVQFDRTVLEIRQAVAPGAVFLDLTAGPLYHVLTDRPGPGTLDVVMPGTFLGPDEEERLLQLLEAHPPAAVLRAFGAFDARHTLESFAPRIVEWVEAHYEAMPPQGRGVVLLRPRTAADGGD